MSQRWKQNIRELLKSVEDGFTVLETMNSAALIELLQTLQEAVICVGNSIEKEIADCEQIMEMLTELAERIYELSLDENHRKHQKLDEAKALCEMVKNEVDIKIPNVFEILFMPYKVSMWDALETIYEAAIMDKNCHVTVMPIPYYHITEDRSNVELEYEGNQFPHNITITDYREYSIPDKLPDVIFIHNPYDDHNRVTRVPQCYFSTELVKYTDHLVYIPYKVCSERVRDGFCVMPGVRNAWRVFVQSETVREVYVKYNPQEKIIVSGSPKIDKAIQNVQCPPAMPKEWEPALDGKIVFLLNTHLNSIINHSEQMIKEVGRLIAFFEEREDIALLWRPHPLSVETAKAMNPNTVQAYQELVEKFKKLKNGIFDESPNPHQAIAISDAYIGDWSSMVMLFGVTGKPVFIRTTALDWNMAGKKLKSIYYEDTVGLETFIDMIVKGTDIRSEDRKEEFANLFARTDGNSGKQIWEYVKKALEE